MREELFPDFWSEGLKWRVGNRWDTDWPLPVLRAKHTCSGCSSPLVHKDWKFHNRAKTGSATPWRCDVRLKCIGCSEVTIYGVVVPKEMTPIRDGVWITWREGRDILADAGFFEGEPNG